MSIKLRKVIGAVKDQTSISLAKVSHAANLEVAILKVTTHDDEDPMDDRHIIEILKLVSSGRAYAAACAQAIGKRISRTRNWVVALKSLMLVLRIFQDGDPHFPREVLHAMKGGAKMLKLNSFQTVCKSSYWDYSAFVRTFALYLDERLDCFITGKLHRRCYYHVYDDEYQSNRKTKRSNKPSISDMKPSMLLDRITYWQNLLHRAIGMAPKSEAKRNHLVRITFYAVVQESFDLYRDISDGIALLLDRFFQLQHGSCVSAFQICIRSSEQFGHLSCFYDFCKSIGIGKISEYPCVRKVSDELMETLHEFLKDQASIHSKDGRSPDFQNSVPLAAPENQTAETSGRVLSQISSQYISLEDLIYSLGVDAPRSAQTYPALSEQNKKHCENCFSSSYSCSRDYPSTHQASGSSLGQLSFSDWQDQRLEEQTEAQGRQVSAFADGEKQLVLDSLVDQSSNPHNQLYNPFLEDREPVHTFPVMFNTSSQFSFPDIFPFPPTFRSEATTSHATVARSPDDGSMPFTAFAQSFKVRSPSFGLQSSIVSMVPPTFTAQNDNGTMVTYLANKSGQMASASESDPFAPWRSATSSDHISKETDDQQSILQQQQKWLEQQEMIISKHFIS